MKNYLYWLSALGLLVSGCTGELSGMSTATTHSFSLTANADEALTFDDCPNCGQYPNPEQYTAIKDLVITDEGAQATLVKADGTETVLEFGEIPANKGIPVVLAKDEAGCKLAFDQYGKHVLFDSCDESMVPFSGKYRQASADDTTNSSAFREKSPKLGDPKREGSESGDIDPKLEKAQPKDECDPLNVRAVFAREFNTTLKKNGINLTYDSDAAHQQQFSGDQYTGNLINTTRNAVQALAPVSSNCSKDGVIPAGGMGMTPGNLSEQVGVPNMICRSMGSDKRCSCAWMAQGALEKAQKLIPCKCNVQAWQNELNSEYGVGALWLTSQSKRKTMDPMSGNQINPDAQFVCDGSPIVFDTASNGFALTSVEKGVNFDLLGFGRVQTAWIQGDDALLVHDLNANGTIDSGAELFGEATYADGIKAANGFAALAALDQRNAGGNANGVLEADDLAFSALKLWFDRNHDGISQSSELKSLTDLNIEGISTEISRHSSQLDRHGNDLRLQGQFFYRDGRAGQMVDAYFTTTGIQK